MSTFRVEQHELNVNLRTRADLSSARCEITHTTEEATTMSIVVTTDNAPSGIIDVSFVDGVPVIKITKLKSNVFEISHALETQNVIEDASEDTASIPDNDSEITDATPITNVRTLMSPSDIYQAPELRLDTDSTPSERDRANERISVITESLAAWKMNFKSNGGMSIRLPDGSARSLFLREVREEISGIDVKDQKTCPTLIMSKTVPKKGLLRISDLRDGKELRVSMTPIKNGQVQKYSVDETDALRSVYETLKTQL
uniref:Uncharacterized protein n=1 Tax=viral metagenome TaxID=1070528 RepID=A0A2V0RIQ8_9ZZZZ